mmetsp:Transcript_3749/g.6410  ORF Transcript_3749/g.6410 Transcript_3749/m.6410 type:complete len:209 (+) Transcript_3749:173-799(+)
MNSKLVESEQRSPAAVLPFTAKLKEKVCMLESAKLTVIISIPTASSSRRARGVSPVRSSRVPAKAPVLTALVSIAPRRPIFSTSYDTATLAKIDCRPVGMLVKPTSCRAPKVLSNVKSSSPSHSVRILISCKRSPAILFSTVEIRMSTSFSNSPEAVRISSRATTPLKNVVSLLEISIKTSLRIIGPPSSSSQRNPSALLFPSHPPPT